MSIETIRAGIHHKYTCASAFGHSCDCGAGAALAKLDQLEEQQRWIPVSELPEKTGWKQNYLVTFSMPDRGSTRQGYGITTVVGGRFIDGSFNITLDDVTHPITHWMPLPEPPKESSDD